MNQLIRVAKLGVCVISVMILIVAGLYLYNPQEWIRILGSNPYLYAGIMVTGAAGFAYTVLRVIVMKANNWYAMLEAISFSGPVSAAIIAREATPIWQVPMILALFTGLGCVWLRFFRR